MLSPHMVFAGRSLCEPRLSPDGRRLAYVVSWGAESAIAICSLADGVEVFVTTTPAPPKGRTLSGGCFDWTPDGDAIIYSAVDANLWRQPAQGGPPTQLTTQRIDKPATCPAVSPNGRHVAYIVDQQTVCVATLDNPAGTHTTVSSGTNSFALDPSWSADGEFLAWHEWDVPNMAWDESRWIVAPITGDGDQLAFAETDVQVQQPRFSPVGSDLAFLCDRSGWLNLTIISADRDADRPLVDEPFEHGGPTWGAGQRSFAWSPDGRRLAYARNEAGFGRLVVIDIETGLSTQVARGCHGDLDWKSDTLVASRSGATTPTQIVVYDSVGWTRRLVARGPVAGFETSSGLVEPAAETFVGADGGTLHALVYRPANLGHGGVICWLHGGPTDQWTVSFNPRLVWFVERGWTVVAPNVRGSTGYGRAYTQSATGLWGEIDTADVTAVLTAIVDRGWARADQVVLMGGSAGGFTALNVLRHNPGIVAGTVVLYPLTDLFADDTWRFEAHYTARLVGDLPGAEPAYRQRSPLHGAADLNGPILILHGSADRVVGVGQSEALASAAVNAAVTLHIYEGEGHGWRLAATKLDELERTETFLRRVAGLPLTP